MRAARRLALTCCAALVLAGPSGAAPPLDGDGRPLPAGALARLGTLRFRHAGPVTAVAYAPNGKLLATGENLEQIFGAAKGLYAHHHGPG